MMKHKYAIGDKAIYKQSSAVTTCFTDGQEVEIGSINGTTSDGQREYNVIGQHPHGGYLIDQSVWDEDLAPITTKKKSISRKDIIAIGVEIYRYAYRDGSKGRKTSKELANESAEQALDKYLKEND